MKLLLTLSLLTLSSATLAQTVLKAMPNCTQPSTLSGKTYYLDPLNGLNTNAGTSAAPWRSLAEAMADPKKVFNAGDQLVLRNGHHGDVLIRYRKNLNFVTIRNDFGHKPVLGSLKLHEATHWIVKGLRFQNKGKYLFETQSNSENNILADNLFYTEEDSSDWTIQDWMGAANGIQARNRCLSVINNKFVNVRFGMNLVGDSLAQGNLIQNFSGDGMRTNGDRIIAKDNAILDVFVSAADGDGNHDDGIQMFNLDTADSFDDVTLENNLIIENTGGPNQNFRATMQGIGIFDGLMVRLKILRNDVNVTRYHGIAVYAPKDSLIEGNNVTGRENPWIYVPNAKNNAFVPVNTIVRNNAAGKVHGAASGVIFENNRELKVPVVKF